MDWDSLLYLSILGTVVAIAVVISVTSLGVRYKRELPKLPIKESLAALRLEREREEVDLAEIQDELAQARIDIREGAHVSEFLDHARPKMEALQAETKGFQDAKLRAERDFETVKADQDRVRQELEKSVAERDRLAEEIAPLRVELAETKARLEHASEDLADYEKKREELASIDAKLPALREEAERLEERRAGARKERDQINYELKDLRREHSRLDGTVTSLKEQHQQLLEAIGDLKKTHSRAGGVDEEHDSRQDLWVPVFPERTNPGGPSTEGERLSQMAQQLDEAKVRIPKRTLDAFHTALKIQDISPLTVLAGISGTGKSLLPRLYSKCMGVHFLNLPVQPGWNSPQDLFGFYNYIEHRFKATPLARAMVQFDQFNRGSWPLPPENKGFEDQVLMVLLDEMNLARVEYYFSELLSRLETRRSINASDPIEREKVEIQLEIGHAVRLKEGERKNLSVSVYPGENVLFTGTMNEDESTMSLSDKVLDRATVLRFGRPAETITVQPNMSGIDASQYLALGTWKSWLKRNEVKPEVKSAVDDLGDIMAKAGTPFGHRVAQGILHYVSLYPNSDLSGQRIALVDQVEQKILPKLRGRELGSIQDALQELSSLIRRMDDEELVKAIQDGQNQLEGTFMWYGLDRKER